MSWKNPAAPPLPAPTTPHEDQFGDPVDYFIRTGLVKPPKLHICKLPKHGWRHQKFGEHAIWCCSTCGQLWAYEKDEPDHIGGETVRNLTPDPLWWQVSEEWVQKYHHRQHRTAG